MEDLNNAVFVKSKKGNVAKENKKQGVYFSTFKSKDGYKSIKFYIGSEIARKIKINDNSRINFAYDKDLLHIWYLLVDDNGGFKVSKDRSGLSFSSAVRYPFDFVEKRMQEIPKNDVQVNSDKRRLDLDVFNVFKKGELIFSGN